MNEYGPKEVGVYYVSYCASPSLLYIVLAHCMLYILLTRCVLLFFTDQQIDVDIVLDPSFRMMPEATSFTLQVYHEGYTTTL